MRKIFFIITFSLLSFFLLPHPVYAAECDKITWNEPVYKGVADSNNPDVKVYTLSATINNCPVNKDLELDFLWRRQRADQINIPKYIPIKLGTANTLLVDVDFLFPGKWEVKTINKGFAISVTGGQTPADYIHTMTVPEGAGTLHQCNEPSFSSTTEPICPADCPPINLGNNQYQCVRTQGTNYDTRDVKIVLKPKPNVKDAYIINRAYAQYLTSSLPPVGGGAGPNVPVDPNAADFESLVTGQGRNTSILGDEETFIATVLKNGGARFQGGGYEAQLSKIYKTALAKSVNPLLIVVMWGVEQSFSHGTALGCGIYIGLPSDFDNQVECGVNTIDNWMNTFELRKGQIGLPVTIQNEDTKAICSYTDPFVYAYEWYTPDCHFADGNTNARKNFAIIMRDLLGLD